MSRFARLIPVIVLALIAAALYSSRAQTAPNACINPSFATDTTWKVADSPVHICNANGPGVEDGVTLTIQPGVTVVFDGSSFQFNVSGTLNAVGTAALPITITGATTTAGSWGAINVTGSITTNAVLNLDYVTIQDGGASSSAELIADRATVTINHSHIQNSSSAGLIITHNASFNVNNSSFDNNGLDALQVNEPTTDLAMTGLIAAGNGLNMVHITGIDTEMHGSRHWTYPGLPYAIDGNLNNSSGDVLTIDPGSELNFNGGAFNIAGELVAQGTADQPILLTGLSRTPGSWVGLNGQGVNPTKPAVLQLDYATIEDGGYEVGGANLLAVNGKITAHHSIIRNSSTDGVRINSYATASILDSQIYNNALYGVRDSDPTVDILATNDWWGAASGPHPDIAACGGGTGDKVTAGVSFQPFATTQDANIAFPLSDYPNLTLTPERWYTPADGVSKINFDITLRDGNGTPLPGRTVKLKSSLASSVVTDGGITDSYGKTLAFLTSPVAGNAQVIANLDTLTSCEGAVSPESDVTFTTPVDITDMLPDAPASYFDGDISVGPQPIVANVPTTISAKFTNPLSTPVTIDVDFGYAQSGVGLVFGPILPNITGLVLQGNSTISVTKVFTPPIAGHYCVQVSYTITEVGTAGEFAPQTGLQLRQFNMVVQQATTGSNDKSADLSKTRDALKAVNNFVDKTYDNSLEAPLAVVNKGIEWDMQQAEKISNALSGDPPRQDYRVISTPVVLALPPIQPGGGVTPARAAALNDLDNALAVANSYGTAAEIAFDRSGGAAAAADLSWESIQDGVMLQYNKQYGLALITAAQKIDALLNEAASEGVTSVPISVADVAAMQANLAGGFSPQEIADAHAVGLTDEDITIILQSILDAKPEDLAGDVITNLEQIRDSFKLLGAVLIDPTFFLPSESVTGSIILPFGPQVTGNTMAQPYDTITTIQVGNPTNATATIDLIAKRIDLPGDWSVQVSPASVTLPAGGQATVTISITAGSVLPQGSRPRVAIEGSIGGQLLGGVVVDILVPYYQPFDGKLKVYLPEINH